MRLAIIGAGGVRTPLLIHSIYNRQEELDIQDLVLMDIDLPRLMTISSITHRLEESGKLSFKVQRTGELEAALKDVDFVITTFRVGGIESRVIDEQVPLDFGILGQETTGAGGFAMGVRSIPVLLNIHEKMNNLCPDAWLINFANPAGMLVQGLEDCVRRERMVGICDAPSQFQSVFASLLDTTREQITLDYFGLNHLGWVRRIIHQGTDHLPGFIKMIESVGEIPQFPFDASLIKSIAMIPNEYLFYYYYSRKVVENIRRTGLTRGQVILGENMLLFNKINYLMEKGNYSDIENTYNEYIGKRGDTYMHNETGVERKQSDDSLSEILANTNSEGYAGVAMELMLGLLGKGDRRMILNIPNQGALPSMSDRDIVEIPALVSKDHIEPIQVNDIPDQSLGLMKIVKSYEHLTIEASINRSIKKAAEALTIHPLIGDYQLAMKILREYQLRHGEYYPELV